MKRYSVERGGKILITKYRLKEIYGCYNYKGELQQDTIKSLVEFMRNSSRKDVKDSFALLEQKERISLINYLKTNYYDYEGWYYKNRFLIF